MKIDFARVYIYVVVVCKYIKINKLCISGVLFRHLRLPKQHLVMYGTVSVVSESKMSNSPYKCHTSSFVLLLQYPATHIGPNIFLSTFLSQTRKFFSSFAVKHRASEPHSTTGLVIVLYIPIFVVLDTAFDLNRESYLIC